MKPSHTSTETHNNSTVTYLVFDVADSSAISTFVISAWKFDGLDGIARHRTTAHLVYKSNPEARYLYNFDGIEATADLYLALMGEDSAGKIATYIRNNADGVSKHVDGKEVEWLTPRKNLVKENA